MRYLFFTIIFLTLTTRMVNAQNIDVQLVNKAIAGGGLIWTFDLQATALAGYTGTEDNWGTMNVRFDLAVPAGALVQATSTGTAVNNFATSASVQPAVPGGPAAGYNTEMGVFIDRTPASNTDLTIGVPVIIASFTVNFNIAVSNMNIVDPRDPATVSGSFYIVADDGTATRKPFTLPGPLALPVKLHDFTVDRYGEIRASNLRWSSASEVNASHFEIERSIDGINFEYLGNVKAAGSSSWNIDYKFIDDKLPLARSAQSIFYYRLKMVDLDGKFDYSEVRSVRFDEGADITLTYYPNPTTRKVFLNMSVPAYDQSTETTANIFDLAGKLIMTKKVSTNGITEIDLTDLPNAAFNVNVEHNGKVYTNRVIKTN